MVLLDDVSDPDTLRLMAHLPANFLESADLTFSVDGRWLAAGAAGHGVAVWDLTASDIATSRRQTALTAHRLGGVAFAPGNDTLAIAASDGRFHLWDWQSRRRPRTVVTGYAEATLAWLDDSRLLLGGKRGQVAVWETSLARLKSLAREVHVSQ